MQKPLTRYAFIDHQNLHLGTKSLGWKKLDFRRFRTYLKEKYGVQHAYTFVGFIPTNQTLYTKLQEAGFVVIFKPILPPRNGVRPKGNCDAELVLQAMIEYSKYEKAVIVTSDGDFYCLVKYLYHNGKLETVLSPNVRNCSSLLRRAARERIAYLDDKLRPKLEYVK